jgi:hypothetical protein
VSDGDSPSVACLDGMELQFEGCGGGRKMRLDCLLPFVVSGIMMGSVAPLNFRIRQMRRIFPVESHPTGIGLGRATYFYSRSAGSMDHFFLLCPDLNLILSDTMDLPMLLLESGKVVLRIWLE